MARGSALIATAGLLVFSRVFGLSVVLPGFVAYANELSGATAVRVGTAFGAYGLTLALMQLPLGWLSDRVGRQPVLLLGTLFFVAGSAGCAMATSVPQLLAARLVQGLGAVSSTAVAMVGESVPASRRSFAMAMVGIPAGMGFFAGLAIAGLLEGVVPFVALFWLSGALGLAAALPVPWLRPGPVHVDEPLVARGAVARLAAAGFAMNFALTSVLFHLSLAERTRGTLLLAPLALALLVMAVATRQADRRGLTWQPLPWALVALALGAAAAVLAGGASAVPWMVGAALFFAAHASLSALLPSQVSRVAGSSGGRAHGMQNLVGYSGTFAAGPIAGLLAARPELHMVLLAVVAAGAALGIALARPVPTPRWTAP